MRRSSSNWPRWRPMASRRLSRRPPTSPLPSRPLSGRATAEPVAAESAPEPAAAEPAPKPDAEVRAPAATPKPKAPDNRIIKVMAATNPKQVGSKAHARFALYADEALARGVTMADIKHDTNKRFIRLD